jgi:hypothetical protein
MVAARLRTSLAPGRSVANLRVKSSLEAGDEGAAGELGVGDRELVVGELLRAVCLARFGSESPDAEPRSAAAPPTVARGEPSLDGEAEEPGRPGLESGLASNER